MRNVMRRNNNKDNPGDSRHMPMVLNQSNDSKDDKIGTLKVENLKKWIDRAVKINFLTKNGFEIENENTEQIDHAIKDGLEKFIAGQGDSNHTIEADLQAEIAQLTMKVMTNMSFPEGISDDTLVDITYKSSSGVKPVIITDQ